MDALLVFDRNEVVGAKALQSVEKPTIAIAASEPLDIFILFYALKWIDL